MQTTRSTYENPDSHIKYSMVGKVGSTVLPGCTKILDRSTKKLVDCSDTPPFKCSESIIRNGQKVMINRAPFIGGNEQGVLMRVFMRVFMF